MYVSYIKNSGEITGISSCEMEVNELEVLAKIDRQIIPEGVFIRPRTYDYKDNKIVLNSDRKAKIIEERFESFDNETYKYWSTITKTKKYKLEPTS